MNNEDLLKFFKTSTGQINGTKMRWHNIKCHPDIYYYMINYFPGINDTNTSSSELLYRIVNNIYEVPKCPICGKPAIFKRYTKGYGIFCSEKCRRSENGQNIINDHTNNYFLNTYGVKRPIQIDKSIIEKMQKTNFERYGVRAWNPVKQKETCLSKYGEEYYQSTTEYQEKRLSTIINRYGDNYQEKINKKTKQTCLECYGVEYIFQSQEFKEKSKWSCMIKYGVQYASQSEEFKEKSRQTCLKKYGSENYFSSTIGIEKSRITCIEKYGVPYPIQNKDILSKQQNTMLDKYGYICNFNRPEIISKYIENKCWEKAWNTKKQNGNTNTSKIEKLFGQYLHSINIQYYDNYDKDPRYPWHVDFYIPNYDLFIEIQGTWYHQYHPYNILDKKDQQQLQKMIEKSKDHNAYKYAIKVWTQRDVEKRNIAKINKLNYLEIFSCDIDECVKMFNDYLNKYNEENKN